MGLSVFTGRLREFRSIGRLGFRAPDSSVKPFTDGFWMQGARTTQQLGSTSFAKGLCNYLV